MKKFILSDSNTTNSLGFKVDLNGIELERFKENPVMLLGHDSTKVIGRWQNIAITDGKLEAEADFDLEDSLSKQVSSKVERGYLKGASIGIRILEMEKTKGEIVATKTELMEASIVAIPSDKNAGVLLMDNSGQAVDFESVKLNFNINQKKIEMDKTFELSVATTIALGLTDDFTTKDVELAVAEKDKKIAELQAKIDLQHKEAVKEYLLAAVKACKISDKEIEHFTKLAAADFDSVKSIIDAKAETATASLAAMTQQRGGGSSLESKTWDELDKSGKLAQLKAKSPELYKQKYFEKFGV
jgi:HK97 family phage prohead protease